MEFLQGGLTATPDRSPHLVRSKIRTPASGDVDFPVDKAAASEKRNNHRWLTFLYYRPNKISRTHFSATQDETFNYHFLQVYEWILSKIEKNEPCQEKRFLTKWLRPKGKRQQTFLRADILDWDHSKKDDNGWPRRFFAEPCAAPCCTVLISSWRREETIPEDLYTGARTPSPIKREHVPVSLSTIDQDLLHVSTCCAAVLHENKYIN